VAYDVSGDFAFKVV